MSKILAFLPAVIGAAAAIYLAVNFDTVWSGTESPVQSEQH